MSNLVRLTITVDMDAGYMTDVEYVSFASLPVGAHYALDHGTIVSVTAERVDQIPGEPLGAAART